MPARVSVVLAMLFLAAPAPGQDAERWFLFGRHGGCSEIAELRRKLPDLPEVRDPRAFVAYLQSKGLKYAERTQQVPVGSAVEVQVPEAGLSLLFANGQFCRSSLAR
jgi:hypothetical protein